MADKPKNIRGATVDPKGKSPTSRQLQGVGFWRKLAETVGIKGYENLSAKQIKGLVPALSQKGVRQAIYNMGMKGAAGGGIAGIAITLAGQKATDAAKKSLARQRVDAKPEVQRRADRAAKKPDELQTEPMDSSKGRNLGTATKGKSERKGDNITVPKAKKKLVAMKDQGKGGKPGDGSTAVKKSLRPKLREDKKDGGMIMKKPAAKKMNKGGMPMVMKDGKKVPAYAADGVGKMNMGGMAKKKPAAKKMMAGGMTKKKSTGYMYGGMAKKPKAKK